MPAVGDNSKPEHALAIEIILDEHRSIKAALQAIVVALPAGGSARVVGSESPGAMRIDINAVRTMLAYLDGFPEQIHHPKEDESLFTLLGKRNQDAASLITALRSEHSFGQSTMYRLQQQADLLTGDDQHGIEQFTQSMSEFDTFYRAHMQLEETMLLPIALRTLTTDDWRAIDATFAGNLDPLRGGKDTGAFAAQLQGALQQLRRG